MVFGWQLSSRRSSKDSGMGRRKSVMTAPPCIPSAIAEDGCEIVPQFFPGYQPRLPPAMSAPAAAAAAVELWGVEKVDEAPRPQRRVGSIRVAAVQATRGLDDRQEQGSAVVSPRRESCTSSASSATLLGSPRRIGAAQCGSGDDAYLDRRRRGSQSISRSSSGRSSQTVVASLVQRSRRHMTRRILRRHHTTRTVSHNDLEPERLQPSRSATFSATTDTGPKALVESVHVDCDGNGDMCIAARLVPRARSVAARQMAYLPPRTAALAVVNL
ncbi:hypothetical protein GGF46_004702 [Coemansia sp. RSA 552]|nr:hypothetical protein GGF46_004702 [Coemansia sp. RSA 552]